MENAKTLVVFYSRTGITRDVARKISDYLACDIEEIVDKTNRSGIFGYLKSGYHAMRKKLTNIETPSKNPSDYDFVIIGTPVWAYAIPPAIRTYLKANAQDIKKSALFCTMGGSGSERTFAQMRELIGEVPLGTLALSKKEMTSNIDDSIKEFVSTIVT